MWPTFVELTAPMCYTTGNAKLSSVFNLLKGRFLANVNSRSRSLYAVARPSVVRRLSVCRLSSVTFVRPTQPVEIFDNVSTPFGTFVIVDIHGKFYGDRPRESPPSGGG